MEHQTHARFNQAPWYGRKCNCFIGGVGSIGSWLSLFLCRIGHNLILCDIDRVDAANLSGQLYGIVDLGLYKVGAMTRILTSLCDITQTRQSISVHPQPVQDLTVDTEVVFACFDNVEARKSLFKKWREFVHANPRKQAPAIFIDGRLTAESYQIFSCRWAESEILAYEQTLYSADTIQPEICSYKSTTHMSANIAADMVKILNNHITNLKMKKMLRAVPKYVFNEAVLFTNTYE